MRSGGERWPATPSRRDRRTEPSKYGEFRPPSQLRDSHPHPPMQRSHQEPQRVAPARLLSRSCGLYLWLLQKSLQRALSNLQRTPTRESKQGERTADSSAATHRIEPAPGFALVARYEAHEPRSRTADEPISHGAARPTVPGRSDADGPTGHGPRPSQRRRRHISRVPAVRRRSRRSFER